MSWYIGFTPRTVGSAPVPPSAPSNLQVLLQGQTSANNTPSPPTPTSPNFTKIGWAAASPGSRPLGSYNIYRGVNGGALTLYDNVPSSVLTYSDSNATLSINGTAGSGPQYYTANTYQYKVSAVDNQGLEGPLSTTQKMIVYQNGQMNWLGDYSFGVSVNYNDTTGVPQGGTADIACTITTPYGGFLPVSGNLYTQWNMWVGACNYLQMDIKPTQNGQRLQLYCVRVGDVNIYNSSGQSYNSDFANYGPPLTNGVWGTYRFPLPNILTDYGPSGTFGPAVQYAVYKFAVQDQTGNAGVVFYVDNIMYVP